ncbi:hypothetical protein MLD38_006628 [Melastoma candidum]|nr:hypothetical protein MLD38_006628 [Melastoma candidum]
MEVVDTRLLDNGEIDEREVRRAVFVALWCIQEKARLRPSMARVVEMLQGRVPVEEPPQTQMIIVDLLSVDEDNGEGERSNRRGPRLAAFQPGSLVQNGSALSYSYAMSTISPR